jgi:hypothetical protein
MKNKQQFHAWALTIALVIGGPILSQATTIFQDNFDSEGPVGSNYASFLNLTVTQGVRLIL